MVKHADLVLAPFLRGDAFTAEEKRRDFEYYEALTVRDLDHDVFDGVHVASQGGAVLAARAGFGGMRDWDGKVSFAPRLSRGIERLVFQVGLRGRRLRVEVTTGSATYTLREEDSELEVSHWGERIELAPGASTERPIPPAPQLPAPVQPAGRAPERRSQVERGRQDTLT